MASKDSASVSEVFLLTLIVVTWIMGVVLAKGFWSTFSAIFIPPWAWYLLAEKLMSLGGLI